MINEYTFLVRANQKNMTESDRIINFIITTNLPSSRKRKKLNVTAARYKQQAISIHRPNALPVDSTKVHADECKSCSLSNS